MKFFFFFFNNATQRGDGDGLPNEDNNRSSRKADAANGLLVIFPACEDCKKKKLFSRVS